jgi:phosphatidylinositol alpha-1,6-mannosyltransferase
MKRPSKARDPAVSSPMYTEGGGACQTMVENTKTGRDLVFVSAGLGLDGGGRAVAGRLLAGACAGFARAAGIGFRILSLGDSAPVAGVRCFGTDQRSLALRVWSEQVRNGRRAAYVFDLLGPSRVQAYVPAPFRAPYLVPLYGIEVWRPLTWDRSRALARATVRLAISEHTVERARPFCPGLDGVEVLPLALEERPVAGEPDPALLDRLGDGFLLIVGRMAASERYKGHDPLLEALPQLGPEARLVIAGEGDDRPRLEAQAAALGVAGQVAFTGFVSEATLAEMYRRCAAFAMPSRGEGFGLVYLEAMRAGKPCIAARGSAAEEIIEDRKTGLLVDPDDSEELAGALGRLLGDPALAREMGEAGRRRWQKEFSIERFRARLAPLLERLMSPHPPAPSPASPSPSPGEGEN